MQECTRHDLRAAREAAKMPRWKLAQEINYSEGTIRAWEDGDSLPDPEDVWKVAKATGAGVDLWWRWMRSTYECCREILPPKPLVNGVLASVVNARHQIADILPLLESTERDSVDGQIDDRTGAIQTAREAREAASALLDMAQRLEQKGV